MKNSVHYPQSIMRFYPLAFAALFLFLFTSTLWSQDGNFQGGMRGGPGGGGMGGGRGGMGGDMGGGRGGRGGMGGDMGGGRGGMGGDMGGGRGGRGGMGGDMGGGRGGMGGDMGGGRGGMSGGPGGMSGDMGGRGGRGGMGGDMGGGRGGMGGRSGGFSAMITQLDKNGNGTIEESEVNAQQKQMLEMMMKRANMEVKYPLSVSKLQESLNNMQNRGPGGQNGQNPTDTASKDDKKKDEKKEDKKDDTAVAQSSVAGFSYDKKTTSVRGFGSDTTTLSEDADKKKSASAGNERFREMARAIIRQNDKNNNETLEKANNEWDALRDNMKAADKNNDGIITIDELAAQLGDFSDRGPRGGETPAKTATASTTTTSEPTETKNSKRIRNSIEYLASLGLPDWYLRKDGDGNNDGQVSMSEYNSGSWSQDDVSRFKKYDLNDDGVISPQECLQVEKKR